MAPRYFAGEGRNDQWVRLFFEIAHTLPIPRAAVRRPPRPSARGWAALLNKRRGFGMGVGGASATLLCTGVF